MQHLRTKRSRVVRLIATEAIETLETCKVESPSSETNAPRTESIKSLGEVDVFNNLTSEQSELPRVCRRARS